MPERVALRGPEIGEGERRGLHSRRHVADTEAVERVHPKVGAEVVGGTAGAAGGGLPDGQRRTDGLEAGPERPVLAGPGGDEDLRGSPEQRGGEHVILARAVLAGPELPR